MKPVVKEYIWGHIRIYMRSLRRSPGFADDGLDGARPSRALGVVMLPMAGG